MNIPTYKARLIIPTGNTKTFIFFENQTLSNPVITAIVSIINSIIVFIVNCKLKRRSNYALFIFIGVIDTSLP